MFGDWYHGDVGGWFHGRSWAYQSMVGFVIGMLGWFYILYEIFAGDAGKQGQASLLSKAHLGTCV